jgi:RHS repeat-associated protein
MEKCQNVPDSYRRLCERGVVMVAEHRQQYPSPVAASVLTLVILLPSPVAAQTGAPALRPSQARISAGHLLCPLDKLEAWDVYEPSDSSWLVTSTAGTQLSFYRYDAFGNLALGTPASPFGYAGQYSGTSPNPGLDNMRARWYDPQTGGLTTRDPDFSATDQAYAYAGGDPVDGSDPSGLCSSWNPFCDIGKLWDDVTSTAASAIVSEAEPRVTAAVSKLRTILSNTCDNEELASEAATIPGVPATEPAIEEIFDRPPDYVSLTVSAGDFGVGAGVVVTYTRFGQVFLGLEGGIVAPGATGAARAGWILDTTRRRQQDAIRHFVDGGFVAGEAYIPFGPAPIRIVACWRVGRRATLGFQELVH